MTTRHAAYIVTLAEDRREDDDEAIRTALRMIAGVISVEPVPSNVDQHIARERNTREIKSRLLDFVDSL